MSDGWLWYIYTWLAAIGFAWVMYMIWDIGRYMIHQLRRKTIRGVKIVQFNR